MSGENAVGASSRSQSWGRQGSRFRRPRDFQRRDLQLSWSERSVKDFSIQNAEDAASSCQRVRQGGRP